MDKRNETFLLNPLERLLLIFIVFANKTKMEIKTFNS